MGLEIPLDPSATGTLLGLARASLPTFELPSLVTQPYAEQAGPTAETRFLKAEARYQVLLEQLPASKDELSARVREAWARLTRASAAQSARAGDLRHILTARKLSTSAPAR